MANVRKDVKLFNQFSTKQRKSEDHLGYSLIPNYDETSVRNIAIWVIRQMQLCVGCCDGKVQQRLCLMPVNCWRAMHVVQRFGAVHFVLVECQVGIKSDTILESTYSTKQMQRAKHSHS